MEFIMGLFVGMVWYEVLFIFILVGCSISAWYNESGFFTVITSVALIYMLFGMDMFSAFSWSTILMYGAGYLAIGIIWSVLKYARFVKKCIESVRKTIEADEKYDKRNKDYVPMSNERKKERYRSRVETYRHPDTIAFWIVFWPGSILGYFFGDFVLDLVKRMGKMYTVLSDKIIDNELK